jgi:hypothetical protein
MVEPCTKAPYVVMAFLGLTVFFLAARLLLAMMASALPWLVEGATWFYLCVCVNGDCILLYC